MHLRPILIASLTFALSGCSSAATPEELVAEKLNLTEVSVADPKAVTAFLADAHASVKHGGYRSVFSFNGDGNEVTVTRLADRTELLLNGWRLGKANQHVIGAEGSTDTVVTLDDGTYQYCSEGACEAFDPADVSTLSEQHRQYAEAGVAVLGILPVRPLSVEAVQTYVDSGPTGAAFYMGKRAAGDHMALCLVVVRGENDVLPQMCTYEGSRLDGIPVDDGARNNGPLNHVIVKTELLS